MPPSRAHRRRPAGFTFLFVLLLLPSRARAVEHPGSLPKDAECSSCHVKKISGKSVHSAMSSPCTVCHITTTQGDMTSVSLMMPKNKICYACHQDSAALRNHAPDMKRECLYCHDAHSSNARMLLREDAEAPPLSSLRSK